MGYLSSELIESGFFASIIDIEQFEMQWVQIILVDTFNIYQSPLSESLSIDLLEAQTLRSTLLSLR